MCYNTLPLPVVFEAETVGPRKMSVLSTKGPHLTRNVDTGHHLTK